MSGKRVLSAIGGFLGFLISAGSVQAIEKPRYDILQTQEVGGHSFEIRSYAPYIVAETTVAGPSLQEASSEGFRRLANFIFGGNRSQESVDMTAPVQSVKMEMTAPVGVEGETGRYVISFVMPSKYTLETLPVPNDQRVTIRAVAARKVAAVVFSGFWSESNFSRHTEALEGFLRDQGIEALSRPMIARYNMPLTPWFLRRNEVLIDVR